MKMEKHERRTCDVPCKDEEKRKTGNFGEKRNYP